MLLVEYNVLDKVKVINEGTKASPKVRLQGKFQKCDEQNNNGRVYPRKVLESQVKAIQDKINERSLVGALDHPANDAIHLSQASHLITKLWVEKNGDVMGECEILSTPNGKIVEALLNDGVKIGISSRGLGSVSESQEGKIVNEDFKLITFDLVSDPSTKGAYPELTESIRENSQRAQEIISKHKKQRVMLTMLESKINEAVSSKASKSKSKKKPKNTKPKNPWWDSDGDGVGYEPGQDVSEGTQGTRRAQRVNKLGSPDRKWKAFGKKSSRRGEEHARKIFKTGKPGSFKDLSDQDANQRSDSSTSLISNSIMNTLKERCWKGYTPVKGKKPYSKGSCKKKK